MKISRLLFLALLFNSAFLFGQIPNGYYNDAQGKTGYALKTALSNIISNGYVSYTYNDLYDIYVNSDSDHYYENDGSVLDIYSENPNGGDPYEYTQIDDKCTTYTSEGNCYNREHIMPQSVFNSESPMKSDAHFVVPVDGYVNGRRSNHPFGEVANPTWTSMNGSKLGPNTTAGYTGTVFEPLDEFKGDIARMLFYFATRYENRVAGWSHDMLNGTSDQVFSDWFLAVLLDWNQRDPVSQKEIDRNNAVYQYQKNRNPFIDHPEWVNLIWNQNGNGGGNEVPGDTEIIATMDFDGSLPQWSFNSSVSFFDNGSDGFYGIHNSNADSGDGIPMDTGEASSSDVNQITNTAIEGDFLFINDLDDEGDNGTTGEAEIYFDQIDISNYNQVFFQFDYDVVGFDSSDYIKYEIVEDGQGQGLKLLAKNDQGSVSEPISEGVTNVSIVFHIKQNGASDQAAIDNIKLIGVSTLDDSLNCDNVVNQFPYNQGFENSFGLWTQSNADDFDWTVKSGSTPSTGTGPSSASEGNYYIYMESSSPNYSNKKAVLESPCFDLASLSGPTVNFKYHMYGDASKMGYLKLDISEDNGNTWTTIWTKSGNQGNAWYSASVDLPSYAGKTIKLRLFGETGTTWKGDMAIDDFKLMSSTQINQNVDLVLHIDFDQYPEETSWTITENGKVVKEGGPYSDQAKESSLDVDIVLEKACYTFTMKDSYGDGMCCNYGDGAYSLKLKNSGELFLSGGSFQTEEVNNFCLDNVASKMLSKIDCKGNRFQIFPNPVREKINFHLKDKKLDRYIILDLSGKIIGNGNVDNRYVDVSSLSPGVYFLKVYGDKKSLLKKIIKK